MSTSEVRSVIGDPLPPEMNILARLGFGEVAKGSLRLTTLHWSG
ncbi:MAG: hypothetical protein RID09_00505 [Coleofasciculus sp. G1-WW12-02]